jgi:pyrroline-5-carboxylate reductase
MSARSDSSAAFTTFIACVHSASSCARLARLFPSQTDSGKLLISYDDNVTSVHEANVVILGVDPSRVEATLTEPGLAEALRGKLLISVVAGWSRESLESLINSPTSWILRTLPNVCAQVSQSLTAIEDPAPNFPTSYMETAEAIFSQIGKTVHVAPRLMAATTAVGGSTPACMLPFLSLSLTLSHFYKGIHNCSLPPTL